MNPGVLNSKITFIRLGADTNEFGGTTPNMTVVLSTFASKQPIRSANQFAIEAGASVLNDDVAFVIRQRKQFNPSKNMLIQSGDSLYTISAIKTYQELISTGFQTGLAKVYNDTLYLYIIGIRQNNGIPS